MRTIRGRLFRLIEDFIEDVNIIQSLLGMKLDCGTVGSAVASNNRELRFESPAIAIVEVAESLGWDNLKG